MRTLHNVRIPTQTRRKASPETSELRHCPECCFEPPHYRMQRKKSGVKAERVKTGPVCSQRRPAGESKACFAEPPQSKRRIPLRRKPAKAPVLASPNSDPAKATCGWFWVPFATKRYKTPCNDSRKTLVFSEKTSTFAPANHIFLQLLLSVLNKATAFRKGMRRVVGV